MIDMNKDKLSAIFWLRPFVETDGKEHTAIGDLYILLSKKFSLCI